MKTFLIAAVLTMAATSGALAQGYVYYGTPSYAGGPYLYDYAPGYAGTYGYYGYAPGGWYGAYDESGNSVRQPNPRSTIRAVR